MNATEFIRLVDALEDAHTDGYVSLEDLPPDDLTWAIEDNVLLVDVRTRADGTSLTLCRLNRRHPLVANLTTW